MRRRAPKPGSGHDWRALVADRPPRRMTLVPPPPAEPTVAPLEIRRARDRHGRAVVLVSGIGQDAEAHAVDLRAWAEQLLAAAVRLEGVR